MIKKSNIGLFILLLSVVLFTSETFAQRVMSDDIFKEYESYQRPKKKFKFSKKKNIAELKALKVLPVDTNSVYVSSVFFSHQNATYFTFTRFFSNGEVFISHEYKNPPSDQECNDLSYGKWGMYSINGNNLIVEKYVRGFPSRYWYNYVKCETDKLIYYKRVEGKYFKNASSINIVESKRLVNLTNHKINWK